MARRWPAGERVRVRNRFDGSWSSGFEIEQQAQGHEGEPISYVVRRMSDGFTLPASFAEAELSPDT